MAAIEAQARIKINTLLNESGWRFFDDANGKANIVLEPTARLTRAAESGNGIAADLAGAACQIVTNRQT